MHDTDAGWILLIVSGVAWLSYGLARLYDAGRRRNRRYRRKWHRA